MSLGKIAEKIGVTRRQMHYYWRLFQTDPTLYTIYNKVVNNKHTVQRKTYIYLDKIAKIVKQNGLLTCKQIV